MILHVYISSGSNFFTYDDVLQVTSILSWSENTRSHFRLKARVIMEKLVRKCGYDVVASFVPERHKKLIVHIRKMNERQKKKKLSKMEDSSREGGGSHAKKSSRPRYLSLNEQLRMSPGMRMTLSFMHTND